MEQPKHGNQRNESVLDSGVLRGVCRRQPEALDKFFAHFYERIFGYVAHLLQDRTLAEDVTHDAFLRIHRGLDRLDPDRDPTAWVFTVVTNTVRDHWRSKEHRAARRQVAMPSLEEISLADPTPRVEHSLEEEQQQQVIRKALTQLKDADREVILLRNYEGLNSVAVAEILEIKPEAVRQRHSRALARLSEVFHALSQKSGRDDV